MPYTAGADPISFVSKQINLIDHIRSDGDDSYEMKNCAEINWCDWMEETITLVEIDEAKNNGANRNIYHATKQAIDKRTDFYRSKDSTEFNCLVAGADH